MTAQEALQLSIRAMERIDAHERLCAWRWAILVKVMGVSLFFLLSILGILLHDKFMV